MVALTAALRMDPNIREAFPSRIMVVAVHTATRNVHTANVAQAMPVACATHSTVDIVPEYGLDYL